MNRTKLLSLGLAAVALMALPLRKSLAVDLFYEPFNTDSMNAPTDYPNLDFNSPNVNEVNGGVLTMNSFSGGAATVGPDVGFSGDITFSVDFNRANNTTSTNQGVQIGDLYFLFHTTAGVNDSLEGAFRVSRNGTTVVSNTMMGFNPAASGDGSVLHHLDFEFDTMLQTIDFTFTDGFDANNVFNTTFNYLASDYVPSTDLLAVRRAGSGQVFIDNIRVTAQDVNQVPEPSMLLAWVVLGGLTVAVLGLRRAAT